MNAPDTAISLRSLFGQLISALTRQKEPQRLRGKVESPFAAPAGRVGRVRIALLTIIEEEFAEAQKVFQLYDNIPNTPYFVKSLEQGSLDIALMQATDRTNVPVSRDVSDLMEDLRPQITILLGVAGGLCDEKNRGREGIQPGDVLIADQVSYVEFLKIMPGGPFMRAYPIDHPSVVLRKRLCVPIQKTFRINDHLKDITPPEPHNFKIHIGAIVSGEKVMGDMNDHVQKKLLQPFDKALAVDMESIGIARAICDGRSSFWYHPRYVVIRGISDLVSTEDNNDMRANWKPFAAHAAALVAKEFVERLPIEDGLA